MKKSETFASSRADQPRAGDVAQKAPRKAKSARSVRLSPPRTGEPVALLEEHFPNSEAHTIDFEYFNPAAREVLVAGSFNNWKPQSTPMQKERGGRWSARLLLKPGRYEYRFVVDGEWRDDPMAERFVANDFGGLNCVVEVKPISGSAPARP